MAYYGPDYVYVRAWEVVGEDDDDVMEVDYMVDVIDGVVDVSRFGDDFIAVLGPDKRAMLNDCPTIVR